MSLYGEYLLERLGKEIIERDDGFATFVRLTTPEGESAVYIEDIFVRPEARKKGVATDLADGICQWAATCGCTVVFGSVNAKANGATQSLKVLIAYGMQLSHVIGDMIYFRKEIGD